MTARASFRQADLTRAVKAVERAGAAGRFKIVVDNGVIALLPVDGAPASDAEEIERRMREAFGE